MPETNPKMRSKNEKNVYRKIGVDTHNRAICGYLVRGKRMPSKKYVTVGTRMSEKEISELTLIANRENISISAIIKLCLQAIINGEIELEKGELKTCVDTHNDAVSDNFEASEFGRRVDQKFDRLRERDYPESFIAMMKEEILSGIDNRIDMLPKKFDLRKMRFDEGGC